MGRTVTYLRVSTAGQVLDGFGIAAQELACAAWADRTGNDVVGVVRDEGLSGTLPAPERPGLRAALAMLRDGDADCLVSRDWTGSHAT